MDYTELGTGDKNEKKRKKEMYLTLGMKRRRERKEE